MSFHRLTALLSRAETQRARCTRNPPPRAYPCLAAITLASLIVALAAGPASAATATGFFAETWDGGVPASVTLTDNAFWTNDGGTKIVLTNGQNQGGRAILEDLNPGVSVDAIASCTQLFIGAGSGADGFSWNFGNPLSIAGNQEGVTSGLAVSLDTYDNGGGDVSGVIDVRYDGAQVGQSGGVNLRTGSFVSLCVTVLPNGEFWVKHDNTTVSGTIGAWGPATGRQVIWAAATGGLWDEHTIEDVTVTTFPTGTFFENYKSAPANTTFYGNGRQDDFYARLTDNAASQQGSAIIQDQNPGEGIGSFNAYFAKYISGGGGADGLSFNFGDVPDASFGEGGAGTGLTVSWPTYNNNRIRVYYGGQQIAESDPRELRGEWNQVSVAVDSTGVLEITDTAQGNASLALITTIPGWAPQVGWRFAFGGRTGGVTDNHAITNLVLATGVCGNGTTETGEQCDEGAANGTGGSCCTTSCTLVAGGTVCRAASGQCDVAEQCTGSSGFCPGDTFQTAGTSCGDAGTECTVQDTCDGAGSCTDNGFESASTTCGDAGTECTVQDTCDGAGTCTDNGFESAGTSCNGVAGECEVQDTCNGSGSCSDNGFQSVGTSCNGVAGECEVQDTCDGSGSCSDNGFQSVGTSCNGVAGECEVQDTCDGSGSCSDNGFQSAGSSCGDAGTACIVQDTCDGSGSCTDNGFASSGTSCNGVAGDCEVQDTCDGSGSCSDNGFASAGSNCGDAGTACIVQDTCDGSGTCTDNGFESAGTSCNGVAGECEVQDTCDGSGSCSDNGFESVGTSCNGVAGECEVQDTCDGSGSCSDNGFESAGTSCNGVAGDCEVQDTCDGSGSCSDNGHKAAGVACGDPGDQCVLADTCDGSGSCTDNGFEDNGTSCDDGNSCTTPDACSLGLCVGDSTICGDGTTQDSCGEECDDGNTTSGDGCSELCLLEGCSATPATPCNEVDMAKLFFNEKKVGVESALLFWKGFPTPLSPNDFGDPVAGSTAAHACVYDDAGDLIEMLSVDRAGEDCDSDKPCWVGRGSGVLLYLDKNRQADGVMKMLFSGGGLGGGKAFLKAKNLAKKGITSMPTGVAAKLAGQVAPTIQLVTDDGLCLSATITEVQKDDGAQYNAQKK
jgi:hypothetical protein